MYSSNKGSGGLGSHQLLSKIRLMNFCCYQWLMSHWSWEVSSNARLGRYSPSPSHSACCKPYNVPKHRSPRISGCKCAANVCKKAGTIGIGFQRGSKAWNHKENRIPDVIRSGDSRRATENVSPGAFSRDAIIGPKGPIWPRTCRTNRQIKKDSPFRSFKKIHVHILS